MPARSVLIALAAGLALADASVVTLALPPILAELDASVEEAAAVLGVYTLVLGLGTPPAAALARGSNARALGAVGLLVLAGASVACGLAGGLGALVAARAAQAAGAAAALVAALPLLDAGRPGAGRRLWLQAAVFGIAVGPALGGALTQALDWRAIFLAQAPLAAAAAVACLLVPSGRAAGAGAESPEDADAPPPPAPAPSDPLWAGRPTERAQPAARQEASPRAGLLGPAVALALVSAALTGVLFLLVLLLISGWSLSPLAAAAVVTVVPVAALVGARIGGDPRVRAPCGCVLVGAGVLALAFLPSDAVVWTLAPQALSGLGMGLALPALTGGLLPERTPGDAARALAARHLGITAALALLAPVASAQLDDAVEQTRERGAALVLDARLPPLEKLELASALADDLDPVDPRGSLEARLARNAGRFEEPEARAAYAELRRRADETLVAGVNEAFGVGFLITGALALLAALAVRPPGRPRALLAVGGALATLALPAGQALARPSLAPEPVRIADPCEPRALPETGGLDGAIQDAVLGALDEAACRFGSSREELVIALVDDAAAEAYEREHGVDPREIGGIIERLLPAP